MDSSPRQLIDRHGIISDQVDRDELETLLSELVAVSPESGSVVEFGCYVGTTSLYIRRVMDQIRSTAAFHVYDSFEGLPDKTIQDQSPVGEQFKSGELHASKKELLLNFHKAGLRPPFVHKGWFNELGEGGVPGDIKFAFLDGDYYDSIKVSLELIAPKLAPHATIVIDDYVSLSLPGAARAADEWARPRGLTIHPIHSLGVIRL